MQIQLEVIKVSKENEDRVHLTQKQRFIIELVIMIIVGLLVIIPFILWKYHFFI